MPTKITDTYFKVKIYYMKQRPLDSFKVDFKYKGMVQYPAKSENIAANDWQGWLLPDVTKRNSCCSKNDRTCLSVIVTYMVRQDAVYLHPEYSKIFGQIDKYM